MSIFSLLRKFGLPSASNKYDTATKVTVSHPELVHHEATVTNSTLSGKIHVGKASIIKDSYILVKELNIGRNTSLWGPNIDIHGMLNIIKIGSFCSIARNVSIQEYNHKIDRCSTYFFSSNVFNEGMEQDIKSRGPITIGNDVWIASQVVIGSGATIGDGAVIGANSVVLGDVPPYAIVAGSPAKVLRYRFDEHIVVRLLALKWWEWDDERLLRNRELFLEPLTSDVLDRVV
jgi:virginiamycin A acetyltransferase